MEVLTSNATTYTGTALFGTHKLSDKVSLTNKTTNALTKASFEAAILAAAAWKFANGELAKPRFTHLIVGEKLRSTAHGIVVADKIGSVVQNVAGTENVGGMTTDNPNKGKCELVVLEELAGDYDDYWFLVDASKVVKPIVRQLRETPSPKMDTDPIRVDRDGKVDFLATGRAAAAPTLPWLLYGGIL
jgi:phage major head subunit gpT-like protein